MKLDPQNLVKQFIFEHTAVLKGFCSPSWMRSAWLQVLRSCIMMFSRLTYGKQIYKTIITNTLHHGWKTEGFDICRKVQYRRVGHRKVEKRNGWLLERLKKRKKAKKGWTQKGWIYVERLKKEAENFKNKEEITIKTFRIIRFFMVISEKIFKLQTK